MKPIRNGIPLLVVVSGAAVGAAKTFVTGAMDSSVGKATHTPSPRRNARRLRESFWFMSSVGLSGV
jgi:hypothetical protein